MIKRNPSLNLLKTNYLFPEIHQRKNAFLAEHPKAELISLGVGDTTEPLPPSIAKAMANYADNLSTLKGYSGYGPEQGYKSLREKISQRIYRGQIDPDDIFISDGAKCDIGRLQLLFGSQVSITLQDPTYPVYLDGSLLQGISHIHFAKCLPENNFFPDFSQPTDLIYFCSPNNPTGATATFSELEKLVNLAKQNHSIILFDAAYSHFIQDQNKPRSILEIPGADEVAIEINSFSKIAGFTGVRLGWTVVSPKLTYVSGESVKNDWKRVISTIFNGASNIAQHGGEAILMDQSWGAVLQQAQFYMENASILFKNLQNLGLKVYGGTDAPYLWTKIPGKNSWEAFQFLLEKAHLITTPGVGFGQQGEGFIRLSAFSHRENILKAGERLQSVLA